MSLRNRETQILQKTQAQSEQAEVIKAYRELAMMEREDGNEDAAKDYEELAMMEEEEANDPTLRAEKSIEAPVGGVGSAIAEGLLKGAEPAMRVLDYAGGNVRTAGADAIDEVFGDGNLVTSKDYDRAISANAPSSAELLKRAGMSDNLGTEGLGIGLDILSDPLTYGTLGVSAIPKLRALLRPTEKATKKLARNIYGLPYRSIEKEAIKQGRNRGIPLDEIRTPLDEMMAANVSGKTADMDQGFLDLLRNTSDEAEGIIKSNASVPVDPNNASIGAKRYIANATSNPSTRGTVNPAVEEGKSRIAQIYDRFTPKEAQVKQTITETVNSPMTDYATGRAIPKTVTREVGENIPSRPAGTLEDLDQVRVSNNAELNPSYRKANGAGYTPAETKLLKSLNRSVKDEQIRALDDAIPGANQGQEWAELQKKRGILLGGHKGAGQDLNRLENLTPFSQVDSILAGSPDTRLLLALKKAQQIATSPLVTSNAGLLLRDAADSGVSDVLLRQLYNQVARPNYVEQ